jgi:hypothetical protein
MKLSVTMTNSCKYMDGKLKSAPDQCSEWQGSSLQ